MNGLGAHGEYPQPTMAVIGSKAFTAEIAISNQFYSVVDPLEAFQMLAKVYFALDDKYPERAKSLFDLMTKKEMNPAEEIMFSLEDILMMN
jgi:hypothetical protein